MKKRIGIFITSILCALTFTYANVNAMEENQNIDETTKDPKIETGTQQGNENENKNNDPPKIGEDPTQFQDIENMQKNQPQEAQSQENQDKSNKNVQTNTPEDIENKTQIKGDKDINININDLDKIEPIEFDKPLGYDKNIAKGTEEGEGKGIITIIENIQNLLKEFGDTVDKMIKNLAPTPSGTNESEVPKKEDEENNGPEQEPKVETEEQKI